MKIAWKKLTSSAKMPERGSAWAAGYDLFADIAEETRLAPHETKMIGTGCRTGSAGRNILAVFLPEADFLAKEGIFVLPTVPAWSMQTIVVRSRWHYITTAGRSAS